MKSCKTLIIIFLSILILVNPAYCDTQKWELASGYNFVSLNVTPAATSSSDLFNDHPGIKSIFRYNPDTQEFVYQLRLASGTIFGTSFPITPTEGFIVENTTPETIEFSGDEYSENTIANAKEGFNLTGLHFYRGQTARSLLNANILTASVFRWDVPSNSFKFIMKLSNDSIFGEDFTFKTGISYFIKLNKLVKTETSTGEVPSTTVTLDTDTTNIIDTVTNDLSQISFSSSNATLSGLAVNNIINTGVTSKTPNGMLRKIKTITDNSGKITITTVPATLEESIKNCEVTLRNIVLSESDVRTFTSKFPGITRSPNPLSFGTLTLNMNKVVIYDDDGSSATENDRIILNGSFTIEPAIDMDLSISLFSLKKFLFKVNCNEKTKFELSAAGTYSFPDKKIKLGEWSFAPIIIPAGPVVILAIPEITVYLGANGELSAGLKAEFLQEMTLTAGIKYENTQWNGISDYVNQFKDPKIIPTAAAKGKVYVGPRASLLLYGISGPYAEINGFLEVEIEPLKKTYIPPEAWWTLSGGIEVNAGAVVDVLGATLAEADIPGIIQWKTKILESQFDALSKIELSPNSDEIAVNKTFNLDNVKIIASYGDETTKEVTSNFKWKIISGGGTISGSAYTPPAVLGFAILRCEYTENYLNIDSVTKTADLNLTIKKGIRKIHLTPSTTTLPPGFIVDLTSGTITIEYTDGSTKTTDSNHDWSIVTGGGVINAVTKEYQLPVTPGFAQLRVTYTDDGSSYSDDIDIKIGKVLDHIGIGPSSISMTGGSTYDLTKIGVLATYNDTSSLVVSSNLSWKVLTGSGSVSGTVFTAAAGAGTATLQVTYTELGISKTANLSVLISGGKTLSSIGIGPSSLSVQANNVIDLTKIGVSATYSDNSTDIVKSNLVWAMKTGSGTVSGTNYTAPGTPGNEVLTLTYTENGISKTADLFITVLKGKSLLSIGISPAVINVTSSGTYDLSSIGVSAVYDDSTVSVISSGLFWTIISGGGSIAGTVYTAPSASGTVTLRVKYTEGLLSQTANLTVNVGTISKKVSSIGLGPSVINIQPASNLDLSTIGVAATYDDSTVAVVSKNLAWTMKTGNGTLSGTNFIAPATSGTTVLTVTYTEDGISVTADLTINILASTALSSIGTGPSSITVNALSTYDLSKIGISAKYSDNTTKIITTGAVWSNPLSYGTISGNIFTAPATAGTGTIRVSYTEGGITKYSDVTVTTGVPVSLETLSTSLTSVIVSAGRTLNLGTIISTAKYTDGSTKDVSSSVSWNIISGSGTVSGTIFSAPASTGTTVLRANYTEGGITRTADLNITIAQARILGSIKVSPTYTEIPASGGYNLLSVTTTAYYSDFSTDIISSDLVDWTLLAGGGTLNGKIYTAPASGSTITLQASYTESGVTKTAKFTVTIIGPRELTGLSLAPASASVEAGKIYYLSSIIKSAQYGDNTSAIITSSFTISKISGSGVLSGNTYTTPASPETAVFNFTYTENGISKSAIFTLTVSALASVDGVYTITKTCTTMFGMTYEEYIALANIPPSLFPKTTTDTIVINGGTVVFGQAVTDQVTGTNNNNILYGKKFIIGQNFSNDTDSIWNGTITGSSVSGTHEIIPYIGSAPSTAQKSVWTYTGTKQ